MLNNDLEWFLNWFRHLCYDQRNVEGRISIGTIDNPGWFLTIDLVETELEGKNTKKQMLDRSEHDWVCWWIEDGKFNGRCGPYNLPELLRIFRRRIYGLKNDELKSVSFTNLEPADDWFWLLNWYHSQCNGDWEHSYGVEINSTTAPGWRVNVNITYTELEDRRFEAVNIKQSNDDWISCFVEKGTFHAICGPMNLPEVLRIFRDWAKEIRQFMEL